jgi:hypothetical protein
MIPSLRSDRGSATYRIRIAAALLLVSVCPPWSWSQQPGPSTAFAGGPNRVAGSSTTVGEALSTRPQDLPRAVLGSALWNDPKFRASLSADLASAVRSGGPLSELQQRELEVATRDRIFARAYASQFDEATFRAITGLSKKEALVEGRASVELFRIQQPLERPEVVKPWGDLVGHPRPDRVERSPALVKDPRRPGAAPPGGLPPKGAGCPTCTTNPGTPAPGVFVGGTGAPAVGPVVLAQGGIVPASRRDEAPAPNGMKPIAFDPWGFRFVVLLHLRTDKDSLCTGTRVASDWILTALHCVGRVTRNSGTMEAIMDLASGGRGIVLAPTRETSGNDFRPCVDEGARLLRPCAYRRGRIVDIRQPPQIHALNAQIGNPDVALLRVRWIDPDDLFDDRKIASLYAASYADLPSEVTLAGYGTSNAEGHSPGGQLLVGWHDRAALDYATRYAWTVFDAGTQSNICRGDSGGPVLAGRIFGRRSTAERPLVVAVNSFVAPSGAMSGTVKDCLSGQGKAELMSPDIRGWICDTAPGVAGCGS